jgi:hypothetical protein
MKTAHAACVPGARRPSPWKYSVHKLRSPHFLEEGFWGEISLEQSRARTPVLQTGVLDFVCSTCGITSGSETKGLGSEGSFSPVRQGVW